MKKPMAFLVALLTLLMIGIVSAAPAEDSEADDENSSYYGTLEISHGTYEGEILNGKANGKGILTWPNNIKGVERYHGGIRYEGDFVDNLRTGKGVYTYPDGRRYEGDIVDGVPNGKGIFTDSNGTRFEGNFVNGEYQGK